MLLSNNICCWDTETSSVCAKTCQVLSIGAVIIDSKKLEIIPNSEFYSLVKPEDVKTVEAKALEINKLNLDELDKAPEINVVWSNFSHYLETYRKGKGKWGCPLSGGYNTSGYDDIIAARLNERFSIKEMFHPIHRMDVMSDILRWRHDEDIKSISFDNIRKWLGMESEGAHNSLKDAKDAAALIIRFLNLYRSIKPRFANAFKHE